MLKRIYILGFTLIFLLTSSIARCFYIATSKSYSVAESYNSKSFEICKLYPTIYDRSDNKLNNNTSSLLAIIKPDEKNMSELSKLFSSSNVKTITDELKTGDVVIKPIDKYADTSYIKLVEITNENSDDMLCKHLLDRKYGGIESAIESKNGSMSINFSVDALGRILSGDSGQLKTKENNTYLKISIDSEIQRLVEASAENLKKGAVVVIDTKTSQLIASLSKGDDYINRATSNYAVGSVFKLVISAAALENNINPTYECKNSIVVGDTTFHCQNKKKHGRQNLKEALANSCNCYFINLALQIGKDKIYSMAQKLGFMNDIELMNNFTVRHGAFASDAVLSSSGQLALIGFGQGVLTDSPLHFASVLSTIANDGVYRPPTLSLSNTSGTRIISSATADELKSYMHYVVTDGTGANANYKNNTAGKTATAQSGIYLDGREILNSWFAGIYPYDNPKYAIVIMCEDGKSGAEDCCPIFRTIVENLENM